MKLNKDSNDKVVVTYGDCSIPFIVQHCIYYNNNFQNIDYNFKVAISLGRMYQNPMAEILNLWNENISHNLVLNINFHKNQHLVNKSKFAKLLDLTILKAVNYVGINLYDCCNFTHLASPLQFISGLGPKKAQYIINKISYEYGLNSKINLDRKELGHSIITLSNIYNNSIQFLKIKLCNDEYWSKSPDNILNFLDVTGIHPDLYALTKFLIESSVKLTNESNSADLPNMLLIKILKVLENPKLLDKLNYVKLLESYESSKHALILQNVSHIRTELKNYCKTRKEPCEALSSARYFALMIKEHEESMKYGQIVDVVVIAIKYNMVLCRLTNGIEARLKINDILEEGEYFENSPITDNFKKTGEYTNFKARLLKINDKKQWIKITLKESYFTNITLLKKVYELDDYFEQNSVEDITTKIGIPKKKLKYQTRYIKHYHFYNVSYDQAHLYFENNDFNTNYIFRPSSRGYNFINLTIKFASGSYHHVEILEKNKINEYSLGSELIIGYHSYSSLEDIETNFISYIIQYANEAITHKKYIKCENLTDLETKLQANIECNSYLITMLPGNTPHITLIYYSKSKKIQMENIKLTTKGYVFHEDTFPNLDLLFSYAKENVFDYNSCDEEHFNKSLILSENENQFIGFKRNR